MVKLTREIVVGRCAVFAKSWAKQSGAANSIRTTEKMTRGKVGETPFTLSWIYKKKVPGLYVPNISDSTQIRNEGQDVQTAKWS